MNPGNEDARRAVVEARWRAKLLDPATVEQHHPVVHRQRLDLIVGDIDRGDVQGLLQVANFGPHLHRELGIKIAERFIEQEDLGLLISTQKRPTWARNFR
ncbi:MAG: hypothetical protein ACOH2H_00280 [Cypionkella sp.]